RKTRGRVERSCVGEGEDRDVVGVREGRGAAGGPLPPDTRGDPPPSPAAVIHDHGLAEAAPDRLHENARREVVPPAWLRRHQAYRPARVVLPSLCGGSGGKTEQAKHCKKVRQSHDTRIEIASSPGRIPIFSMFHFAATRAARPG